MILWSWWWNTCIFKFLYSALCKFYYNLSVVVVQWFVGILITYGNVNMQIDSVSWNMQLLFVDHDDFWEKKNKIVNNLFLLCGTKVIWHPFWQILLGKKLAWNLVMIICKGNIHLFVDPDNLSHKDTFVCGS